MGLRAPGGAGWEKAKVGRRGIVRRASAPGGGSGGGPEERTARVGPAARTAQAALGGPAGAALVGPAVVTLADVAPEAVRWLWRGRVPLGKLTVLDGDPGVGKSTL